MTRTGVSSPTRMSAWRLSSVEMTGSAWMSASSVPLERAQERGEREAADAGREDQVERRAGDVGVGVADGRHRVAAEVDDVDVLAERLAGVAGSGRWTSLLKNWLLAAQVVLDAELLDVGPVDEDDLGLDRELRGAHVEPAHEVGDARRCGSGCR